MSNEMNLKEFSKLIEEYKKTNNETVELKVSFVDDLLNKLKESDIKQQILLIQKYNLIIELKNRGVKPNEIRKILQNRFEIFQIIII